MTASLIEMLEARIAENNCQPDGLAAFDENGGLKRAIAIVRQHEAEQARPKPGQPADSMVVAGVHYLVHGRHFTNEEMNNIATGAYASGALPLPGDFLEPRLKPASEANPYRMPDGRPIFGEGSPHDIGEHLDRLVSPGPASNAYRKLEEALRRLIKLKNHKDRAGKTRWYEREQPKAWAAAKEALAALRPQPATDENPFGIRYDTLKSEPNLKPSTLFPAEGEQP